jgi:acetyl esterase/lipase
MKQLKTSGIVFLLLFIGFTACKKKDPEETPNGSSMAYNVAYGSDARHKMDIYLPENRSIDSTKVLIFIHGGAWTSGDKNEVNSYFNLFKEKLPDYAIISMNYRLCTNNPYTNGFPAQEQDVMQALNFIKSNTTAWNVSNRFALVGTSAGGHLALLHAYKNNSDSTIKAVAAYFPPSNLADGYDNYPVSKSLIELVTGGTVADVPQVYFESSPVNYVSTAVPTILFHGTSDNVVPIEQTYALVDSLSNHGKPHDSWYTTAGHGFPSVMIQNSVDRIQTFFNTHLP